MKWKIHHKPKFEYESSYSDLGGPWSGHKYFAYDLVRAVQPKHIVELGSHLGCSLFSMAQAVKDTSLTTRIDAVDTWKGDEHAGFYSEEVYETVQRIKKTVYPKQHINLVRMTFDEARKKYKKNSIDILHIDGLHTYEGVKHDFDTWIDAVHEDGIVLFHDTAVKKWGFGIYKLWDELKKDYATIDFPHSFGLGVLFKNRESYSEYIGSMGLLLQAYYTAWATAREYRFRWRQKRLKQ